MQFNSSNYLNLEGFIEFLLQLGYFMFTDYADGRPSEFLPLLFNRMRDASFASSKPLFQAQFEELALQDDVKESEHYEEPGPPGYEPDELTQLLKDLTHEVNANPAFVLPEGFAKVRADKIKEEYEPDRRKYPTESERVAVKVLDELVQQLFDIHIVEPKIKYEKFFIVKP